mmetsp:Transcript_14478/g.46020  ORF Transcript_14478/g.46020 Transcript_14478/m.46020 type:complete len:247 (-) Transcript_14478:336-1076(-)
MRQDRELVDLVLFPHPPPPPVVDEVPVQLVEDVLAYGLPPSLPHQLPHSLDWLSGRGHRHRLAPVQRCEAGLPRGRRGELRFGLPHRDNLDHRQTLVSTKEVLFKECFPPPSPGVHQVAVICPQESCLSSAGNLGLRGGCRGAGAARTIAPRPRAVRLYKLRIHSQERPLAEPRCLPPRHDTVVVGCRGITGRNPASPPRDALPPPQGSAPLPLHVVGRPASTSSTLTGQCGSPLCSARCRGRQWG